MSRQRAQHVKKASRETLELVLVRHGDAIQNLVETEFGSGLSRVGNRQAVRVAKRLAGIHFDHIYASDLPRAHTTAMAILKHHKKTPFTVTEDAREVMTYHNRSEPKPPSKESERNMVRERARVERLRKKLFRTHKPGERILLVCHGQLIKLLTALFAGVDPQATVKIRANNTGIFVLCLDTRKRKLDCVALANCIAHLLPSQIT